MQYGVPFDWHCHFHRFLRIHLLCPGFQLGYCRVVLYSFMFNYYVFDDNYQMY